MTRVSLVFILDFRGYVSILKMEQLLIPPDEVQARQRLLSWRLSAATRTLETFCV